MPIQKSLNKKTDLVDIINSDFRISRGHPFPLGTTFMTGGINFAVFSKNATDVTLVLFDSGGVNPIAEFPFDSRYNRTGDIWHALIKGLPANIEYGYRVNRKQNDNKNIHRFDSSKILIDPYAKALTSGNNWGDKTTQRSLIIDDEYDWEFDQPLNIPLSESIIYELHTRGFTQSLSSKVNNPGTFKGLVEKIPYFKDLGVTAIELLPINEFSETDTARKNPHTGENLLNFWGYHSLSFFAPKASYAANRNPGAQIIEFKEMIKAFHKAGIEIILDVVFNHTAEGDQRGPTLSFRGLDNNIYYIINPKNGEYLNFSGCGNTLNCNHPVVRDMILECLRYWVIEMHIDGFRFDLASILGRGQDGTVLSNPPLLERIAEDPILSNTKLIAEAWDAAGLYQVGSFPSWGRWAEWNAKFRDDVRRFTKGDAGISSLLADSVVGSPSMYNKTNRNSCHSINFVTCHDGFTLNDLVSYNEKHNFINGENNNDGCNNNLSWNCGFEGSIDELRQNNVHTFREVESLRIRQIKNMATLTLVSRGVPMLLAGDEFRRTQKGNNNAYCQDNEISWVDWSLLEKNSELYRFFQILIQFRKTHPSIRSDKLTIKNRDIHFPVIWHGVKPLKPDWSNKSNTLAWQISEKIEDKSFNIYIAANSFWKPQNFYLPKLNSNQKWHSFIDTFKNSPEDIHEIDREIQLHNQTKYKIAAYSMIVLVAH